MLKISGAAVSAALLLSTCAALPARADVDLKITDSGGDAPILATAAASSSGVTTVGVYGQTLANSGVLIADAIGTSESTPYPATLQLQSLDLTSTGGGSVTFTLSADGFKDQDFTGFSELLSATTLNNATISLTGYEGTALFDETNAGPTITLPTTTNASGVTGFSPSFSYGSPFSLTEVATVDFGTGGGMAQINFGGTLTPTPEPASIGLFASVLAGVGLLLRKRNRNSC